LEKNTNVMPVQPSRSWRGNMEDKSNPQIWRSCQETATKWLETGGRVVFEGMLTQSNQSVKAWLWCHSGLTTPGNWRVLRTLLLVLLLWQPDQPNLKILEEDAPVLFWRLLS
jgi:hypothetical protein